MPSICIVEDHDDVRQAIVSALSRWYSVRAAASVAEAQELVRQENFDLMLLDINLPDGTGFELCARLRSEPPTQDLPVIFLSGRKDPIDKMMAFSFGADDYITKPFELIEAKARIEARLSKKTGRSAPEEDVIVVGPLVFDRIKQRALIRAGSTERDLGLTALEFKLIFFLASQYGRVMSRPEIIKSVWNPGVHVGEDCLYTHISSIRRKLGDHSDLIESVPRVGYRLISDDTSVNLTKRTN